MIVTVRPNQTLAAGGASVVGAASSHAATADEADSSYVLLDGPELRLGFAEPAIPEPGARLESVVVRVRASGAGCAYRAGPDGAAASETQYVSWSAPTTATLGAFAPGDFDAEAVGMALAKVYGLLRELRIYALYVDFVYVGLAGVTIVAPLGVLTDQNPPVVAWKSSRSPSFGSGAVAQTAFEVRLFDAAAYNDPDFDIERSHPVDASGVRRSSAATWPAEVALANGDHRVYVRVQSEAAFSAWAMGAFTVAVPAPGEPALALTPESADARIRLDLAAANLIANPSFEVAPPRLAGWSENVGGVVARPRSAAGEDAPLHGDWVARVDTDGAVANQGLRTASIAVAPSVAHTFSVWVHGEPSSGLRLRLIEFDAADAQVGATGADFPCPAAPARWQRVSASRTFGATGVKIRCVVATDQSAEATTFFVDQGELVSAPAVRTDAFELQRSVDAGESWQALRSVLGDGLIAEDDGYAFDCEAPNASAVDYRARAVHYFSDADDELLRRSVSGWVAASGFWSGPEAWLKHPFEPELKLAVDIYSLPTRRRPARQGVFMALGRACPVVIFDRRGPTTGELVLDLDAAGQQTLDALLDAEVPLLLQLAPATNVPDRWLAFTEQVRDRIVDKLAVTDTLDSLPWIAVERPEGNLLAWPTEEEETEGDGAEE